MLPRMAIVTPLDLPEPDPLEDLSLPGWLYHDPEYHMVEMERVMRPSWQVVCHVSDIAAPGDWRTTVKVTLWLPAAGLTVPPPAPNVCPRIWTWALVARTIWTWWRVLFGAVDGRPAVGHPARPYHTHISPRESRAHRALHAPITPGAPRARSRRIPAQSLTRAAEIA